VVISIIALLISLLLPALGAARRSARRIKNQSNIRGIQQGLVIYGNDHQQLYPGLERAVPAAADDQSAEDFDRAFTDAAELTTWNAAGNQAGGVPGARMIRSRRLQ
jgi:type II secretory pathway pseudopilin PulG